MDLVCWTVKSKFCCIRYISTQENKAKGENNFYSEKCKKHMSVLYIIIHLEKGNEKVILEASQETKSSSHFHWQYNL